MPQHSYSRCWIHLIWPTFKREKVLHGENARDVTKCLMSIAESNGIHTKALHVNPDHVHALIDLPATQSVDGVVKLLKGSSSRWININRLVDGHFRYSDLGWPTMSAADKKTALENLEDVGISVDADHTAVEATA